MQVLRAAERLRDALDGFEPGGRVAHTYHPLRYAWEPHERFVRAYGDERSARRALLVGINPSAWGAVQTGIPFADAATARDWLGIEGAVGQPGRPHPKRPVLGFSATRRDGSGANLYGWARARFGTAARFFEEFYVVNYCPLAFFDAAGAALLPAQLSKEARAVLWPRCDAHLADVARALDVAWLLPLGGFAEERARAVASHAGLAAKVHPLRHPSPVNPLNNAGWRPALPPGI